MSDYKVTEVGEARAWKGKYGEMVSYPIHLEGFDGEVELAQKPETAAPQTGQTLTGTIDTSGSHGPKFKKDKPPMGGSRGGGKSPGEQHSIERQTAFKGAVELLVARINSGSDPATLPDEMEAWFNAGLALIQARSMPGSDPVLPPESGAIEHVEVSPEALRAAANAYIEEAGPIAGVERSAAKKKLELKLAAMGITSADETSPEQARELMEFFNE